MPTKIVCNIGDKNLNNYILKVSMSSTEDSAELVVEKKSPMTFLGYIFSWNPKHTYALDRIDRVLKRTLQEQPPDSSLEICRKIFNTEVKEQENSLWTKVVNYCAKLFGFHRTSLQPIFSVTELFEQAQSAALQGDISKAASILEDCAKQSKNHDISEADICQVFDIQDDTIGVDWKGICNIGYYNEHILFVDADADPKEPSIHTHVSSIQSVLTTYPRGFLFLKKSDKTLHPIRLNAAKEVEIYNRKRFVWEKCTDEALQNLKLDPGDLCISLGSPPLALQGAGVHYPLETPFGERAKNHHFYHEAQGPDSGDFCAIHATNAFFGFHAVDIASFYQFAREQLKKELNLDSEALYRKGQNIADVRRGSDPGSLLTYLKELGRTGKLSKKCLRLQTHQAKINGEWQAEAIEKIPKSCDRLLVGYGGFHFAALRKDAAAGKWYLIDSMHKESQDVAYDTLEDALKKPTLADSQKTISIIY